MQHRLEIDLSRPANWRELPDIASAVWLWWIAELTSCAPASWTARFAPRQAIQRVVLSSTGDGALDSAGQVEIESAKSARGGNIQVYLEPSMVLRRAMQMPALPAHSLRSAIGLQIEELTPFSPDEVFFDFRIRSRDRQEQTCILDLAILPKRTFNDACARAGLDSASLHKAFSAIPGDDEAFFTFDLEDTKPAHRGYYLSWLLWPLAVGLGIWGVMWSWDWAAISERTRLEAQIGAIKPAAETSLSLGKKIVSVGAPLQIMGRENLAASPLAVISALSRTNPPDVTLTKIELENGQLQLAGSAASASAYIELLEKSDAFEAAKFAAPVTPVQGQARERFSIALKLTEHRP